MYSIIVYKNDKNEVVYITNTYRKESICRKVSIVLKGMNSEEVVSKQKYSTIEEVEEITNNEIIMFKDRTGEKPFMNLAFDKVNRSVDDTKYDVLDRNRNILLKDVTDTEIRKAYGTKRETIKKYSARNARLVAQGYPPQPTNKRIYIYAE